MTKPTSSAKRALLAKKQRAVFLYARGKTQETIAAMMKVSTRTIKRWIAEYRDDLDPVHEAFASGLTLIEQAAEIADTNNDAKLWLAVNRERRATLEAVFKHAPPSAEEAEAFALNLPVLHEAQWNAKDVPSSFLMLRAGRRWGKTLLAAAVAAEMLRDGQRLLYIGPKAEQTREFWRYLKSFVNGARFTDNPRRAWIEGKEDKGEIAAVSSWNGEGLRGTEADLIIMDEAQLQENGVVESVVMPMLLTTSGRLWLIFTPPSAEALTANSVKDKTWINRFWREKEIASDWTTIVSPSSENPKVTKENLATLRANMSNLRYRVEVLAEALDDVPGALWQSQWIQYCADHTGAHPRDRLMRVVIGVDPAIGAGNVGIIAMGIEWDHRLVVLQDSTVSSADTTPGQWAQIVGNLYRYWNADAVVAEVNQGGDMVRTVLEMHGEPLNVIETTSSRGKWVRAEPISLMYERGQAYHCAPFRELEEELTGWLPSSSISPDRLDAMVFAANELAIDGTPDMDEVYRLLEEEA